MSFHVITVAPHVYFEARPITRLISDEIVRF